MRQHKLAPIENNQYLAMLRRWRHDHLKGPLDKPYVPSTRKLTKAVKP